MLCGKLVTEMQMSVACAEKVLRALFLTKASVLYTHINHSLSSNAETWQCQNSTFEIVCFNTFRWDVPQQVTEYTKAFGDNAMSEYTARSRMMRPWRQPYRRTTAKPRLLTALELEDFQASIGWFGSFQKQFKIKCFPTWRV